MQRFHGMVNFYCSFVPNLAQVLRPLTDLLKGGSKTLEWTDKAQEAFQNAKRLLAATVPLQHPSPNAEHFLATDASDTHINCNKNQETIGNLMVSFPANSPPRSLATPCLIVNCWQLLPQFAISAIFVKDNLSSFGLITNHS